MFTGRMSQPQDRREDLSFEALMEQLESIVARLEDGDLSLEEALEAYQQGVNLAKSGHQRLAAAERRIEEVARGGQLATIDEADILGPEGSA